jgi:hypothetical protein
LWSESNMSQDRFDGLMQLAELRRQLRESRRTIAWQTVVALYALIVAAIAKSADFHPILEVGLAVGSVFGGIAWIRWNWKRDKEDMQLLMTYANEAEQILIPDRKPKFDPAKEYGFWQHPVNLFQTAVLLVLATALVGVSLGVFAEPKSSKEQTSGGEHRRGNDNSGMDS